MIPASLTWLLQPLDTHCFAAFKARVRKLYKEARINSIDGSVDLAGLLRCIGGATRSVLQGTEWASAFDSNGFGAAQRLVSERVKTQLSLDNVDSAPTARPSLVQLQSVFPRGARIPPSIFPAPVARVAPLGPQLHRRRVARRVLAPAVG